MAVKVCFVSPVGWCKTHALVLAGYTNSFSKLRVYYCREGLVGHDWKDGLTYVVLIKPGSFLTIGTCQHSHQRNKGYADDVSTNLGM